MLINGYRYMYMYLYILVPMAIIVVAIYYQEIITFLGYSFLWTATEHSELVNPIFWNPVWNSSETICRELCPLGEFMLTGMTKCEPLLTCDDFNVTLFKVRELQIRGHGMKRIFLSSWRTHSVIVSELLSADLQPDFDVGVDLMKRFHDSPHIIQLVGVCNNTMVTEYHPFKSIDNLHMIRHMYPQTLTLDWRLNMCVDYVEILHYLHTHPDGIFIMCDSNSLEKTLGQYLFRDDLKLILNDLDAIANISRQSGENIICGHKEIGGDFVAPEQLWPFDDDSEYNQKLMRPYDEKIDIYKIPDICNYFLENVPQTGLVKLSLLDIHTQCKLHDPKERPTAQQVLNKYKDILNELNILKSIPV